MSGWIIALVGLGLAFDVFSIAVSQGSVLGNVKARGIVLMCLMVCAWQAVAMALGYGIVSLIGVDNLSSEVQKVWGFTTVIIFIVIGGIKVFLVHYRKAVPEVLSDIDFKKTCAIASSTSIYTLFAGFGCGLVSISFVTLIIVICCITLGIVVLGVFVGYRNGELDKRFYWSGGVIFIIAGIFTLLLQLGLIS